VGLSGNINNLSHFQMRYKMVSYQNYYQISYNDYMSLISGSNSRRIPIDWELYEKCLSLFDSSKWEERCSYYQNSEDGEMSLEPYCLIVKNNKDSMNIVISVLDDEWFLVDVKDYGRGSISTGPKQSYWRCDQFDGMLELLRDKEVIK